MQKLFLIGVEAKAAGFAAGFAPARKIAVHYLIEGGTVVGHKQMGEFMNDYMLDAPVG